MNISIRKHHYVDWETGIIHLDGSLQTDRFVLAMYGWRTK